MKYFYISGNGFWLRRRLVRFACFCLSAVAVAVSLVLTLGLLGTLVLLGGKAADPSLPGTGGNAANRFEMLVTNRLSDALNGIRAIDKVYWLSDENPVAPEPDPSAFGESADPAQLEQVLEDAADLLEGKSMYFAPSRDLRPSSTVRYYLDETIFAVTWKEVHDSCVYTFSEVVIAHPSQFRRFLSDNAYGSGQQFLTTEMAQSVNAVLASSGDFYAHRNYGAVVYGGEVCRSQNGQMDLCLMGKDGDLQFLYADEVPGQQALQQYIQEHDIRFSLAFGPVIVDNGQLVTTDQYPVGEIDRQFSRAALCQMEGLHYLVAAANMEYGYPNVPTLRDFSRRIQQTGCAKAYTLDGGQTASIVMNNTLVNQVSYGSQRRISDIIYFATAVPDGG